MHCRVASALQIMHQVEGSRSALVEVSGVEGFDLVGVLGAVVGTEGRESEAKREERRDGSEFESGSVGCWGGAAGSLNGVERRFEKIVAGGG